MPIENYDACGCGEYYALGALYAMERFKMKPHDRVTEALSAAEHLSGGVKAPFNIVSI